VTVEWGEQVSRSRRSQTGTDRYGEPVYAWTTTTLAERCSFDPGGSVEPVEVGRAQVVTTPRAYFCTHPDVVAEDRLILRGATYTVEGDPAHWRDPWGSDVGGTVVELRRVEG